jgi:hypothetical protein
MAFSDSSESGGRNSARTAVKVAVCSRHDAVGSPRTVRRNAALGLSLSDQERRQGDQPAPDETHLNYRNDFDDHLIYSIFCSLPLHKNTFPRSNPILTIGGDT